MAITLALIMGIMIMCATFTVAPVIERTNGVTALQHCSGSPIWIDWLARYIWDFFNIFPAFITITIILFAAKNVAGLSSLTDNYELFTVLFIVRVLDAIFTSGLDAITSGHLELEKSVSDSDFATYVHLESFI